MMTASTLFSISVAIAWANSWWLVIAVSLHLSTITIN